LFYIQQIVNGLSQGAIYALVAISFSLILGIIGIVNFVHGEVMMLGAFAGLYTLRLFPENILLAFIVGFAATWVLGITIDLICYKPFRNEPEVIGLICTIGYSFFLKNSSQIVFGTEQQLMPDVFGNNFIAWGNIRITYVQIFVVAIVILLTFALQLFLHRTKTGISLRAISMNKKASALLGVNINRTISLGNSLGCALGGIAGILLGIYYNAIHPMMGSTIMLKAFICVVFGGLNSVLGAAIGGILLGLFENLGVAFFGSGYRDIIGFIILILILLVKPSGLLGRKGVEL